MPKNEIDSATMDDLDWMAALEVHAHDIIQSVVPTADDTERELLLLKAANNDDELAIFLCRMGAQLVVEQWNEKQQR
jgi:hypothetical protein